MHHWYEKFHGTKTQPLNLDRPGGPVMNYYPGKGDREPKPLIAPVTYWWPSTFHMQFVQFWFKIYHANDFWYDMNHKFYEAELAYWEDLDNDPNEMLFNAYGGQSKVHGKVFGCGAGYSVAKHNGHYGGINNNNNNYNNNTNNRVHWYIHVDAGPD